MTQRPGANLSKLVVKRLLDIIGSLVGLFVLSPVLLVIGLAIRLDSPGPALFRQTRVGLDGRQFTMLKFRTMRVGGDDSIHRDYIADLVRGEADSRMNEQGEPVFLLDDPRITRLGDWLRKRSLDELPNLMNVLKGDMSLVGPRPPIPYEVELYDDRARRRISVKPGMTGLAQVNGRGSLTFWEIVELDLKYIDNWSLMLDLKILLETFPSVITQRGV